MAASRIPNSREQSGLTLIEVLIALAIIAIALTAIIKSTTQNIRSTGYLQHKTLALWVAEDVMNKARLGVINLSDSDDSSNNTVSILGEEWHWRGKSTNSANPHIKKINVEVYATESDDASPTVTLESYSYVQ